MRVLAALALMTLTACGRPARDPVERLLDDLAGAVEDRDAEAVGARLADDFQGEDGLGRAEAVATVRRYLAAYDSAGVQVFAIERPDPSRVSFRVNFTGKPREVGGLARLLPSAAIYEFELELSGEGDGLKVRRAAWRPWEPPVSP